MQQPPRRVTNLRLASIGEKKIKREREGDELLEKRRNTSMIIRDCHSRSLFLSSVYIHNIFMLGFLSQWKVLAKGADVDAIKYLLIKIRATAHSLLPDVAS